jgi:hypothetical protein
MLEAVELGLQETKKIVAKINRRKICFLIIFNDVRLVGFLLNDKNIKLDLKDCPALSR